MDPIIKSRLKQDIIVKPFIKISKGDKIYGEPITLKGYAVPKVGTVVNREGISETVTTVVYLDGKHIGSISEDDEIQVPFSKMRPVKAIYGYPGINCSYEIMEVRL